MSKWQEMRTKKQSEPQQKPVETMEEIEKGFQEILDVDKKDALIQEIQERRKIQAKTMAEVGATDYYFTVCFNSYEQLKEFCDRFGLDYKRIHMDGRQVAKQLGRALETPDKPRHKNIGTSKEYIELSREL